MSAQHNACSVLGVVRSHAFSRKSEKHRISHVVVRLLKGATRYAFGPAAVAAITLQQTGASSTCPSVG